MNGPFVAQSWPASPEAVQYLLTTDINRNADDDWGGRSEWRWFRLEDGTLIVGFYPQGDVGYFGTERWRERDLAVAEREDWVEIHMAECADCGAQTDPNPTPYRCPKCEAEA